MRTLLSRFFSQMQLSESSTNIWIRFSFFLRELWLVLKLHRILYFYTNMSFKIPNMTVKCSRSLFRLHNTCFLGNFPMLYCCKDWKNVVRAYFEQVFLFDFQAFQIPSWNISFISLWLKSSIYRNVRNFLRVGSFFFSSFESYLLKYERNIRQERFIFRNVRKCAR